MDTHELVYVLLGRRPHANSRQNVWTHRNKYMYYIDPILFLLQRHHVEEIAIAEAVTEWKGKLFKYWVYGCERKVFCPDYPVKCAII